MWTFLLACLSPGAPPAAPLPVAAAVPGQLRLSPVPPPLRAPVPPGVRTPGAARRLATGLDPAWLSVSPDGGLGLTVSFQDSQTPILSIVDLVGGGARPLPPPRPGSIWLPHFLGPEGASFRVVALWEAGGGRDQGLYSFRLDDPAGTFEPWAVTGTHVREFYLVNDRTQLVWLSFVPGSLQGTDELHVAPIVGGRPALDRAFRIAPEIRSIQNCVWNEATHRFGYESILEGYRTVELREGAAGTPWPEADHLGWFWNELPDTPDAAYAVGALEGGHETTDVVSTSGKRRPLLRCEETVFCRFSGFSPVRREFYFGLSGGGGEGEEFWASEY